MAANEAVFRHGYATFVNHTLTPAVPAGEVQPVIGAAGAGGVLIPHLDVPANTLGAYAIGGGVYEVTSDAAITFGTLVYWNDATNVVTATATGNRQFGYAVSATAAAGKLLVYHQPA